MYFLKIMRKYLIEMHKNTQEYPSLTFHFCPHPNSIKVGDAGTNDMISSSNTSMASATIV